MGINTCRPTVSQLELIHQVKPNRFAFQYGSDHSKTVVHKQLIIHDPLVEQKLRSIILRLQQEKSQYSDPLFKVVPIVLKSESDVKACRWQRPQHILGQRYSLVQQYTKQISIGDEVMQYFGAFLEFIVKHPQLLKQIVQTQPNTYGLYVLAVNVNGDRQQLIIDDQFLCQSLNKPLFSQPIGQQIWPLVLQKAWTKILGSVSSLQHHQPWEPYLLFVNRPYSTILTANLSLERLKDTLQVQGRFMIVESKLENDIKIGLSGKKFFVMVCSFLIRDQFFMILRNVCGKFSFRGNWTEPTPEQIREVEVLGHSLKAPGSFIVDQQELQQFQSLTLFHYIKGHNTSTTQFSLESEEILFQFELRTQLPITITLAQTSQRPSALMIDLFSISTYMAVPTISIWASPRIDLFPQMATLEPSTYIIRIRPMTPRKSQTCCLSIYSQNPVQFQHNQSQYKQKFVQFMQRLSQNNLRTTSIIRINFEYKIQWYPNRAIVFIKNSYKSGKTLQLDLHFPNLKNLTCLDPCLKPLCRGQIVSVRVQKHYMVVFEKIVLHAETSIGEYSITSY